MDFFGIKFAPLNTPLHRRMETLSTFLLIVLLPLSMIFGILITAYILLFTKYWIISVIYITWIVIDKNTPVNGGRRQNWVNNLRIFTYAKNFFPATLKLEEGLVLDPKRNYLFCAFPHGVLTCGVNLCILSNACDFNSIFPNHTVNNLTLDANFKIPILRDVFLSLGGCSVSSKSMNYLLSYPGGGRIAVLIPGGAEEGFYARPGSYNLVLKNRKGFIKVALKNGCPLVPVFSFGEIDLFDQVQNPRGSLLRKFQDWFKQKTKIAPIIIYGRGFLQYSFGFVPKRRPLNVVVGRPIEVEKNEHPSQGDIDTLHEKFITELRQLFDTHKHKYLENPNESPLIIC